MRMLSSLAIAAAAAVSVLVAPAAHAELGSSPDGQTVYDSSLHVTWLANANLAGTPAGQFGVPGISPSGSMTYAAAQAWVAALNDQNYLGHHTWTLPVSPPRDPSCSTRGTHDERFGVGCTNSALGNLYANPGSLQLSYPQTAVPVPPTSTGPFVNLQPYLYWSDTTANNNGYDSFSFNTGFQGSNTDNHVMYVLPMFDGPPPGTGFSACGCPLEPTPDGSLVYDPVSNVTWLADANVAADGNVPCDACSITPDGSMTHTSAEQFVAAMDAYAAGAGWLGVTTWKLPPTIAEDATCSLGKNTRSTFGFGCSGSPMGELYYNQLLGGLPAGTPVVGPATNSVGPFSNLQPYLYWSCQQAAAGSMECGGAPAENFQWSFSFGNGFQGTDVVGNALYVLVYAPDPVSAAPLPTPRTRRG